MTENKRFIDNAREVHEDLSITDTLTNKRYNYVRVVDLLNELNDEVELLDRENQALKNHIERNTISRILFEDVLDCAKNHIFYDDENQVEVVDWIAQELGVDME